MAVIWAVSTGNWNNAARWNTGTLPTPADEVHANGFNVTIDIDIEVIHISTRASGGAAQGGAFLCSSSRTITADVYAGSTVAITFSGNSLLQTLNGNVYGATTGNVAAITYNCGGSGNIVINGNITGGTVTNNAGITNVSSPVCTVTINGNLQGGTGIGTSQGGRFTAVGVTVIINGDVIASNTSIAGGMEIQNSVACTVNGDVYGSLSSTGVGITLGSQACPLIVNGNVYARNASGIGSALTLRNVTINGNVYGSLTSTATTIGGIYIVSGSLTLNISGTVFGGLGYGVVIGVTTDANVFRVESSANASAIEIIPAALLTSSITLTEASWGANGFTPVRGRFFFADSVLSRAYIQLSGGGGTQELLGKAGLDWNDTILFPLQTDVRNTVVYANGNKTGNATFPNVAVVATGAEYGANGTEFIGTLAVSAVLPSDINDKLEIINEGIKKASILVPHTANLTIF